MPRVLVTMITWNRLNLTRNTLRTFRSHNGENIDFLFVDNGSEDRTVRYLRKRKFEVLRNKSNLGIFMATRRAWLTAYERDYDYIINLQNDFPCIRPIPLDDIFAFLDDNHDVGFVQLNDKAMLMYPRADGSLKLKKKPRKNNLVTGKRLKYAKWQEYGNTKFSKNNYHFNFNPNIFKASLAPQLVTEIHKPRERYIMEKFHETGLKAAKMHKRVFDTVIRKRQKNWLH